MRGAAGTMRDGRRAGLRRVVENVSAIVQALRDGATVTELCRRYRVRYGTLMRVLSVAMEAGELTEIVRRNQANNGAASRWRPGCEPPYRPEPGQRPNVTDEQFERFQQAGRRATLLRGKMRRGE